MALNKISDEELKKILAEHEKWLDSAWEEGERADLSGLNLVGANLYNAKLNLASFNKTNLKRANLTKASCYRAEFKGACLEKTSLIATDFSQSDLTNANLRWANLYYTYFMNSKLVNTDLRGSSLSETIFTNVDLSNIKNIEECMFLGPCTIDFRTIEKSKNLPLSFLRGCGLPDRLIEYLPSLTGDVIEYYSCFISYSTKDQEFAERLYADLQNKGVRCWFAPEDLKTGDKFRVEIDNRIRLHDKLLIILSENSINSAWVEKEVETAFEKERETGNLVLFPIRLDDSVMETKAGWAADIRRSRHIGDFTKWKDHGSYQKAFERLLADLKGDGK